MDTRLIGRLEDFGPPWLRYMLTLSEAVRTGQTWVVASGDDVALWDTDAGAVLPLWPTKALAANVAEGEAQAVPLDVDELLKRLLPFLVESDANVSLFPNFDDDMLVEPAAVTEDLSDLVAQPSDLAAELTADLTTAVYDEWALLESPGVESEEAEGWSPSADEAPSLTATSTRTPSRPPRPPMHCGCSTILPRTRSSGSFSTTGRRSRCSPSRRKHPSTRSASAPKSPRAPFPSTNSLAVGC